MNIIKLIVITLLMGIVLNSCKQDDIPTYDLSEVQKSFSNFKEGSTWVMRDSVTGTIDTFQLLTIDTYYQRIPAAGVEHELILERKDMEIGQFHNGSLNDTAGWQIALYGRNAQLFMWRNRTNSTNRIATPFNLSFINSNISINGNSYSGVSINEENKPGYYSMKVCLDIEHILLKIYLKDVDGHFFVWELMSANIIR